jgi:hypothetical protein
MTEIIFPVSPCFGLATLHSMSGLLTLLLVMFTDDMVRKYPLDTLFALICMFICHGICVFTIVLLNQRPYKLNRSDYDFGRRFTMIPSYMTKGSLP